MRNEKQRKITETLDKAERNKNMLKKNKIKTVNKKKGKCQDDESESCEELEEKELTMESGESEIEEMNDFVEMERPSDENIQTGKYLLVQFRGGKRNAVNYRYVCCVQSGLDTDEELKVMGLRSVDSTKRNFTVNESDVSYIKYDQILGALPDPDIHQQGLRLRLTFSGPVDILEQ